MYHLRSKVFLGELAKFKEELVKSMKEVKRKNKHHQACMGQHTSPIEISDSPSGSEAKTNSAYCQYLLTMANLMDSNEDEVVVYLVSVNTWSGHAYSSTD